MFSNIEVWPSKNSEGKIKARGRVTVADAVNINFNIAQGSNGLFVGLPSHKGKDGNGNDKWYSDVFIEDKKVYSDLQNKVLAAYRAKVGGDNLNQGEASGPSNQDNIPF